MTDRLSKDKRSWNMSRIKNRDTGPEKAVRSMLHKMGYRFRLHVKDLPGRPDIVLPRYHTVIFVHGCFWHRHEGCKLAYTPKSNIEIWSNKFKDNIRRDAEDIQKLKTMGWRAGIIWQCQIEDVAELEERIKNLLPQ